MTAAGPRHGRVFVDTSAWFALADLRDDSHTDALRIQAALVSQAAVLYTTNLIIPEAHALFLRRLGRRAALLFVESIDASNVRVVRVNPADEQSARTIIRQYSDKDFSLTDATSFAVMNRLTIPEAFVFDRDFQQYGVSVLT